jgi:hypothetical protein
LPRGPHGNGAWSNPQPLGNGASTVEQVGETPVQRITDSLQLYQRLAKAEAERDLLLDLVADLRAQRDREAEERRRLIAVLTGPRVPWWRRWFR